MLHRLSMLLVFGLVAACTEGDTYPVSGQTCTEDDPVLELDAADCAIPPATGIGTF